ncbi:hypothetical protein [Nonomuraea sp. CA-141351]|uniref:hypothetical protein n=1 Tax=Nonomuraea sp. CA-141351 TaxID=3239996 RepID=UPI003D94D775
MAWLVEQLAGVLAVEGLSVVSVLRPGPAGEPIGLVEWSLGWEERLRMVVEDEPRGASPARCRCGERSLRWEARAGFFVCSACGAHVSEVEERGLVAKEAG